MKIRKTVTDGSGNEAKSHLPWDGEFVEYVNMCLNHQITYASGSVDACASYIKRSYQSGLTMIYEPEEESTK